MRFRRSGGAALVAALGMSVVISASAVAGAGGSAGDVRTPEVSGPVTGGAGISDVATSILDFESVGYARDEWFVEGEASAYEPVGTLNSDGKWTVEAAETAPFKTRIEIIKPEDPADFNGTVFVEWLNVTGGFDAPVMFIMAHNGILREGAAWVGVTAQAVGVQGGIPTAQSDEVDVPQGGLVGEDPARYGTLTHPGDSFSYDIFSQAGVAVKGDGEGANPLDGYAVKRVIAAGESQSAGRMTTYVNAVHPIAGVYDGFFIQSRFRSSAPLAGTQVLGTPDAAMPAVTRTRKDVDVPVLTFETESDVGLLGYANARQPDSTNFRLWEVAGTSHADAYTGGPGVPFLGDLGQGAAEAKLLDPTNTEGGRCPTPSNAGGQHVAAIAALLQLEQWVKTGTAPPKYPRMKTTGTSGAIEIARDEQGIALGGIRTPLVDAPLATNDGLANAGSPSGECRLFGNTKPFDEATLAELYPKGSDQWLKAFNKAADKAVDAGVWPEHEAENFKTAAADITFG